MAPSAHQERFPSLPENDLRACVHCGLCLNACPTYLELGTEMDSPRGRIYLIDALHKEELPLTADVVRHLDLCLDCRACETACPSGVRYGSILEDARVFVEARFRRPLWDRWRRRLAASIFSHPDRLRVLLAPLRVLRALGLWGLVRRVVPAAGLLSSLSSSPRRLPSVHPAIGAERARVGLLLGCVNRELFGAANEATIRVLNRNGVAVVLPPDQGCCGALHLHGGDRRGAVALARRNLAAFTDDLDAVIVNSAGCGSAMKEYGELFAAEGDAARAAAFAKRVRDVNEFLTTDLPIRRPTRRVSRRVVVHDACHLVHGQRIRAAPRDLLRQISGVELVELAESDLCCGSAGSYNLTEPEMAHRLGERKVENIIRSGASCVAVANPGCALQIQSGLRSRGLGIEVLHPVQLLDEAYDDSEGGT